MSDKMNAYVIGTDRIIITNQHTMQQVMNKLGIMDGHVVYACCIEDCTPQEIEYKILVAKELYAGLNGGLKVVTDYTINDIELLLNSGHVLPETMFIKPESMRGVSFTPDLMLDEDLMFYKTRDFHISDLIKTVELPKQMRKNSGLAALAMMAAIASTSQHEGQKPFRTKTGISGSNTNDNIPNGANRYHFYVNGNVCNADTAVFSCIARNITNARKKFQNRKK